MSKLSSLLKTSSDKSGSFFEGALLAVNNQLLADCGYPLQEFMGDKRFEAFGLDTFGDIFLLLGEGVARLSTETSAVDEFWPSIEAWLSELKDDPDTMVGRGFLLNWQSQNGDLKNGHRLAPKMPFIFGGSYDLENIVSLPIQEILGFRAHIARQIRDLPDGSRIMFDTV